MIRTATLLLALLLLSHRAPTSLAQTPEGNEVRIGSWEERRALSDRQAELAVEIVHLLVKSNPSCAGEQHHFNWLHGSDDQMVGYRRGNEEEHTWAWHPGSIGEVSAVIGPEKGCASVILRCADRDCVLVGRPYPVMDDHAEIRVADLRAAQEIQEALQEMSDLMRYYRTRSREIYDERVAHVTEHPEWVDEAEHATDEIDGLLSDIDVCGPRYRQRTEHRLGASRGRLVYSFTETISLFGRSSSNERSASFDPLAIASISAPTAASKRADPCYQITLRCLSTGCVYHDREDRSWRSTWESIMFSSYEDAVRARTLLQEAFLVDR